MAQDDPYWVELRIHGVSGTPPEEMLGTPHATQIAGDQWGRFFRPLDQKPDATHVLEGYHWGQFTSGSWQQGLWLVLIPFGFVNAAAFMVPHPGDRKAVRFWHAVVGGLIRAIGVGVTCTFALATGLILIDLLAWQVLASAGWLHAVENGKVMTAGVLAAGALVLGLHRLGNQSRQMPEPAEAPGSIAETTHSGLCRKKFYSGDPDAPTLARLHLALGWAVIALMGVVTAQQVSDDSAPDLLRIPALLLVAGIATLVTFLGDPSASVSGTEEHERWHRNVVAPLSKAALVTAGGALVATAALIFTTDAPAANLKLDDDAKWLAGAMAVAVSALLLSCSILALLTRLSDVEVQRTPEPFRRYARGLAPWAAASTGLFLAVGFAGAFVLGTARLVGASAQTALVYRVTYAWAWTALLVVALAIAGLVLVQATKSKFAPEVVRWFSVLHREDPQQHRQLPDGPAWPRTIAGAIAVARVKNVIPLLFLTTAGAGLAMTWVATLEMFEVGLPSYLAWISEDFGNGTFARALISIGTWALIGLASMLLLLGRRALRTQQARRGINVIWDVMSFWPHSAHPFVPAAYSTFAVMELRNRIRFHLGLLEEKPVRGPAAYVVVAAHSQGSLITFATMMWLGDEELPRVGLVTCGSQLQVAFPRAFPAYVNVGLIRKLYSQLGGRWINLYRETDPIAGPVLSWDRDLLTQADAGSLSIGSEQQKTPDTVDAGTGRRESGNDWRLLDPTPADAALQLGAVVGLARHSGFPLTPDWAPALSRVVPLPTAESAAAAPPGPGAPGDLVEITQADAINQSY